MLGADNKSLLENLEVGLLPTYMLFEFRSYLWIWAHSLLGDSNYLVYNSAAESILSRWRWCTWWDPICWTMVDRYFLNKITIIEKSVSRLDTVVSQPTNAGLCSVAQWVIASHMCGEVLLTDGTVKIRFSLYRMTNVILTGDISQHNEI